MFFGRQVFRVSLDVALEAVLVALPVQLGVELHPPHRLARHPQCLERRALA